MKYLTFCLLLSIFSAGLIFCKKEKGGNQFKGVVLLNGDPKSDVHIKNLSKRISTASDKKGRFSIEAEVGDLILFEKEEHGIAVKAEKIDTEVKVELKELQRSVFYIRNYEPLLFQGEIFVVIPETRYLSPLLSNGMVLFLFPQGISEAFVVSATLYVKLNLENIQDYEVLDLQRLSIVSLPEKVTVSNLSKDKIVLKDIFGKEEVEIYSGKSTYVSPGIYSVISGPRIIENFAVLDNTAVPRFELYPRQDILREVRGRADTLFGEKDVIIWAEGSGMVFKSDPLFSVKIPRYSKRIFFSKSFRFPKVVKIDDNLSGSIDVELGDVSYVRGNIYPGGQTYFISVEKPKDENLLLLYMFRSTDFSIILPYAKNIALSITSPGLVPRIIDLDTFANFIDLGTIFLCGIDDEECIIEEGKAFLKFGLYWKAREVFKFAHSDIGKIGLFAADFGLLLSDFSFSISEKGKEIFYHEWQEIYREAIEIAGELVAKGTSYKFCHNRITIFGVSISGCIGTDSLRFMVSILEIVKAINLYFYGHKLTDDEISLGGILFPEPEYVGKLGAILSSADILRRENYFDPSSSVSLLIDGFRDLSDSIKNLGNCQDVDELVCLSGNFVSLRTGQGSPIPVMNSKFGFQKVIDSLAGDYELGVSDIISLLPLQGVDVNLPDFFRVNLSKFLKDNDLRAFFPAVISKDRVPFLAVEVEVPFGFMDIRSQRFVEPMFWLGDSPHFWHGLSPLLDKDGVFPEPSTDYFQDYKKEEFIVYFYFDDPTFGRSVKLSPCSLPVSWEIRGRWCAGDDAYLFRFPTNQMLNDTLAVVQKYLKLQFLVMFMSTQIPLTFF